MLSFLYPVFLDSLIWTPDSLDHGLNTRWIARLHSEKTSAFRSEKNINDVILSKGMPVTDLLCSGEGGGLSARLRENTSQAFHKTGYPSSV